MLGREERGADDSVRMSQPQGCTAQGEQPVFAVTTNGRSPLKIMSHYAVHLEHIL